MQPFTNALHMGGDDPVFFVTGTVPRGSKPAGVAEGDVVIVLSNSTGDFWTTVGGVNTNQWTQVASDVVGALDVRLFVRRLDAVDAANPWTDGGVNWVAFVFRGAIAATWKSTKDGSTSVTPNAYTPDPSTHKGTVVLVFGDGGTGTPSTGYTDLGEYVTTATAAETHGFARLDGLDGGVVGTLTGFTGSNNTAYTFEITG